MRIIRYQHKDQAPQYGWILDNQVGPIKGDIFGPFLRQEATIPLAEVKLLAPVLPSKILCIGRNYVEHAKEHDVEVPKVPLVFLKPPSSVLDPEGVIILPPQSAQVEHEGGAGGGDRQARAGYQPGEGEGIHLRLHHRQRRHGTRPAEIGWSMDARQGV